MTFVGAAVEQLYDTGIRFILLDTKTENHSGLIELTNVKRLPISPRVNYEKVLPHLLEYDYIVCIPANKTVPIKKIIAIYQEIVNYLWLHDTNRVIIVEESHNWNENASKPNPLLEQIAREGRSSKMFVWFITQRLQNFPQILWSQCSHTYLWHFNIPTDIRYGSNIVPDFDSINRDELLLYHVLEWDNHNYRIIPPNEIKRKTPHRG